MPLRSLASVAFFAFRAESSDARRYNGQRVESLFSERAKP